VATYGDLQAELADELNRSDLTSQIAKSIQEAIRQLERNRFYFNEQIATTETVIGQDYYPMPDDFLYDDVLSITFNNSTVPMQRRTKAFMEDYYDATDTGVPRDYDLYTNQIRVAPVPDDEYTLTLSYVKRLAELASAGDTNAWITDAYDLLKASAKQYLYFHYLRNYDHAQALGGVVSNAYSLLRGETERRILTGRVRATSF
jgi:hypothetical protein